MEEKKEKKRWEIKVIPWTVRIVGLGMGYYLLAVGNLWFIPVLVVTALGIGSWMGRKIHGDTK